MPVASRRHVLRGSSAATFIARGTLVLAAAWMAAAVLPAEDAKADAVALQADPIRALDGVYQLSWSRDGSVRIEESRRPDFAESRIVYEGWDQAATLSGRTDGIYYYRALPMDPTGSDDSANRPAARARGAGRPLTSAESVPSVQVEVAHHSLGRAMSFFTVGLVVFASTVALVVRGDIRCARGELASDGGSPHE